MRKLIGGRVRDTAAMEKVCGRSGDPKGRWFGRETGRGFAVEFFYVADTLVVASAAREAVAA